MAGTGKEHEMLKVFEWGSKVNFVDDDNFYVGYDTLTDCCEYADWFISLHRDHTEIPEDIKDLQPEELPDYSFSHAEPDEVDFTDLDAGLALRFCLVSDLDLLPPMYLYLFNNHNGYYGHGWTFQELENVDIMEFTNSIEVKPKRIVREGVL